MSARPIAQQPTTHHSLRRALSAAGVSVVALAVSATPALAFPPPDPGGSGTGGTDAPAPVLASVPTVVITDSLSTAQVVGISLLVSLVVAVLLVAIALVARRRLSPRASVLTIPEQRPPATTKEPISANTR